MGKSYSFQELDTIYLAPANALVSDVSKIENVFDYVNGLYEAVLRNDKEAIDKVMCIMQARAYNYARYLYAKGDIHTIHDIEDIINEGSMKILEKRVFNFKGQIQDSSGFYPYLRKFYDYAFYKIRPDKKLVSMDENPERDDDNHQINDRTIPEAADITYEPFHNLTTDTPAELNEKRSEILAKVIMNSKQPPHQVISFCYSVLLPKILLAILKENQQLEYMVDKVIDYVWENAYSKEYTEDESRIGDRNYAKFFAIKFNKVFDVIPCVFSLQEFAYENFVIPALKYRIYQEKKKKKERTDNEVSDKLQFLRRLRDELVLSSFDTVDVNRENLILAEVARYYIGNDAINQMSDKFQDAFNFSSYETEHCKWIWSAEYEQALTEKYKKYGHNIENVGKLVYAKYFGNPLPGETRKPNYDYLTNNIRRFSERMFKDIAEKAKVAESLEERAIDNALKIQRYSQNQLKRYNKKIVRRNTHDASNR